MTRPSSQPSTDSQNPLPDWVGIDVAKDRLAVAASGCQPLMEYHNDEAGLAELCPWLGQLPNAQVVCEATGGDEFEMAPAIDPSGVPVSIVNPRAVRDLAKGLGQLAKTDAIDARIMARDGAMVEPPATVLASESAQALKPWLDRCRQRSERLVAEKTRRQPTPGLRKGVRQDALDEHRTG